MGFVWPVVALVYAAVQFVCRWIFVCGYKKGPKWRAVGGLPVLMTTMIMFIVAIAACAVWQYRIPSLD